MDAAKIRLSAEETALITNADWILTKNGILDKVKQLLAGLQTGQQDCLLLAQHLLPAEVLLSSPKISKGENYRGLPWLMLDQPRCFEKQAIFAIRSLFWWGRFFSVTLHLSGRYKIDYAQQVIDSYSLLQQRGIFICTSDDQWEHHFEDGNYTAISRYSIAEFQKIIQTASFIKLSLPIALGEWDMAQEQMLESFELFIAVVTGQGVNE